jgi:hypothetical protein
VSAGTSLNTADRLPATYQVYAQWDTRRLDGQRSLRAERQDHFGLRRFVKLLSHAGRFVVPLACQCGGEEMADLRYYSPLCRCHALAPRTKSRRRTARIKRSMRSRKPIPLVAW